MAENSSLQLSEKYRPRTLKEFKNQEEAIREIEKFIKTFPKNKAIILTGPAGVGKTSLAIAFANDYNLELFELNASDLRNRTKLNEILRPALMQHSLFKKGKLILMDEADGITSTENGGLSELLVLIEKTSYPMIITTNNIWQRKFNLLRRKCPIITLKELSDAIILQILREVLEKEGKKVEENTLRLIAKNSRGDARSALNDLQTILDLGEEEFISQIDKREKEESIFNVLKKIFQESSPAEVINIYENIDMDLDEIFLWIEENIPRAYEGEALVKAIESLSKADLFRGRIYRQQYWRFLVYENFFLSFGIAAASHIKRKRFIRYEKPSRILKIWLANKKNEYKKSLVKKYAKSSHMSFKKAMAESFLLPLILDERALEKLEANSKEKDYLKERREDIIKTYGLERLKK